MATLDQDLPALIDRILNSGDEIVLFLMADHGMRYGEWFKVIDGSHEHKLPSMFTIVSKSIRQCRITAEFDETPLENVVDIISTILNAKSHISGDNIKFSGKGCN